MTLEQFLRSAAARLANSTTPQLDARVLARHVLALDDAGLILAATRELTNEELGSLDALLTRRAKGEPVAYIIGEKEFYGLNFRMAPGVLAPRPDSEALIEAARERRNAEAPLRILDLGTGTGSLLCALLTAFPNASGIGVDINPAAVKLAEANAHALGLSGRATFRLGDWMQGLDGAFDLIVSNPPYIPESDRSTLAPDVVDYEDHRALFAGAEGLDAHQRILAAAPARLVGDGLMILEFGADQERALASLAEAAMQGARISTVPDLAGRPRALVIDLSQQKRG